MREHRIACQRHIRVLPAAWAVCLWLGGAACAVGDDVAHIEPAAAAGADVPAMSPGWFAREWPMFRGPTGQGQAGEQAMPSFHGVSGTGILWKTPVPLPGMNSPVIWGERVFLTGADREVRMVFCFHAADGRLLWSTGIATPHSAPSPDVMEGYTGYAAPTAATDGWAVYAIFANGDVAAVDFAGAILWIRSLGAPDNVYGHASSLLVHGERLWVQLDQGHAAQGLSRLLALDCRTGDTVWDIPRPVAASWATPVLIETAVGEQLVTAAAPYVLAYAPADGAEIWRARVLEGDVASTPVHAGGRVFAATPDLTLFAIRPDGQGDVTDTHRVWVSEHGVPDLTSPVSDGQRLLLVTTAGLLTLHDVATGALLWEHEIEDEVFYGSPVLAGGRFYVLSREGRMYAVESGELARVERVGDLGERTYCSPALAGGRLYLRGVRNLYGIGAGQPP